MRTVNISSPASARNPRATDLQKEGLYLPFHGAGRQSQLRNVGAQATFLIVWALIPLPADMLASPWGWWQEGGPPSRPHIQAQQYPKERLSAHPVTLRKE